MEALLNNFGVDWKLLLAQLINFAILFVLLRKFAYKPILGILRKRREEIEKGVRFTEEAEQNLKSVDEKKSQILGAAKNEALAIVVDSQNIAKEQKEEILKETAKKADGIIADAKRAAEGEKAKMEEVVYQNAESLIRLGLEQTLLKMTPQERDSQLIKEALKELKATKK